MAAPRRILRVNSLLKEIISGVIRHDLKHYFLPELLTITGVETSRDLRHAKVFVNLINGSDEEKKDLVEELQKCAPSIARKSSKKVVLRYFPVLTFVLDNSLDEYMKIDSLLQSIKKNDTNEELITEDIENDEE